MFNKVLLLTAALLLSAATAGAAGPNRKDLRILDAVWAAVNAYSHFTIFDDIIAGVRDGVITLMAR